MFSIADLVGCGSRQDELKKEQEEEEAREAAERVSEKMKEVENNLKALKLKHAVVKKERDELLTFKRELTPVKDAEAQHVKRIRDLEAQTTAAASRIKDLEAQLADARERTVASDGAAAGKADVERQLQATKEETRNLQLHLETTREVVELQKAKLDELETRSKADKQQYDAMKAKLESVHHGTESADAKAMQRAQEELVAMKNRMAEAEQQLAAAIKKSNDSQGSSRDAAELEKTKNELGAVRTVVELQKQRIEELEGNAQRDKAVRRERDDLAAAKAKLEVQVADLERQVRRNREELALMQQEHDELIGSALAAAKGEVVAYRDRINELEAQAKKDRERAAALQRDFDELISGRIVTHGESPTRLADRCKAVKDKLEAASIRSKALISGFLEKDENDQALYDEDAQGLSEARRAIAERVRIEAAAAGNDEVKK